MSRSGRYVTPDNVVGKNPESGADTGTRQERVAVQSAQRPSYNRRVQPDQAELILF